MEIDSVKHGLAIGLWIVGCFALAAQCDPVYAFFFFIPTALGPHAVTHWLCYRLKSRGAGGVLVAATLAYAACFFYFYMSALYIHLDAQGGLSMLIVWIASLPVMVPLWIWARALERRARGRADAGEVSPAPPPETIGSG